MSASKVSQQKLPSAPAVLLLGAPGAGKTYSIGTLAKRRKIIYVFTDPGGDESLIDSCRAHGVSISNLHWHYLPPVSDGWGTLQEMTDKVNMMNYDGLTKLQGINKSDHKQFYNIVGVMSNFVCQRSGKALGNVCELDPMEYAVVFDSLTGLNKIARDTTVGAKPTMHQGEWGVAMSLEETFIRQFVADIRCPRVMIGHVERQTDEVAGRITFLVSLLGNKLAPQIPHLFSDVIFASTEGGKFQWATMDDRIALKTRNLELKGKLPPDFEPIVDRWEQRIKEAQESIFEQHQEQADGA